MGGGDRTAGRTTGALALLCFTSGSMDAIAFLALGEVFTSAMSGNTILLGLAIGQGHVSAALHSLAALVGYVIGVAMGSLPVPVLREGRGKLALEALFLAGFAALWLAGAGPGRPADLYGLILLSAIGMGLQGALGRALGIPGLMTVIFTSTYTAIVAGLTERLAAGARPVLTDLARRQLTALGVYLGSAIFGAVVATDWRGLLPFVPLSAVLALLAGLALGLLELVPHRT